MLQTLQSISIPTQQEIFTYIAQTTTITVEKKREKC